MTDGERKANSGNCSQPCRWSYKLVEETRPGQYYEIEENPRGTHILSTKDLCLVKHLKEMIEAGIDSFKVEGRTKSLYYVSAVAKAYREAINKIWENPNTDMQPYYDELLKVGNRGYTTGFYLGEGYPKDGYSYDISKGLAGADFLCEICGKEDDWYRIKIKNTGLKIKNTQTDKKGNEIITYTPILTTEGTIEGNRINLIKIILPSALHGKIHVFPNSSFEVAGRAFVFGEMASPRMRGAFKIANLTIPEILLNLKKLELAFKGLEGEINVEDLLLNGSDIQNKTTYDVKYDEDLVINGLGFVKIVDKGIIDVYIDQNVDVFLRKSLI